MITCRFKHAAAEGTGLEDGCVDLVSICLVMHELPRDATHAIIAEAFRILRPGGTFAIMVRSPPQHKQREPCRALASRVVPSCKHTVPTMKLQFLHCSRPESSP